MWLLRRALVVLTIGAVILTLASSEGEAARKRRRSARTAPARPPTLIISNHASAADRAVAAACKRALGTRQGAVVAMDPRTGRVIAVVNPELALVNAYTPCSVFKIVVAIAGLSEGAITPSTTLVCHRGCWTPAGHGPLNLRRALAVSCNPFFERVGERVGWQTVQRYAHLLGLGSTSGINLTGESPGLIPEQVPASRYPRIFSHATGVATSAVQLGVLLSATINGGIVFQPEVAGPSGFVPRERWRLPQGTRLDGLAEGFLGAVNEGSATPAFDPDVVVAGKTGSCARLGWFASYHVSDEPDLVIVVLTKPGSGRRASAVAGQIYTELYKSTSDAPHVSGLALDSPATTLN